MINSPIITVYTANTKSPTHQIEKIQISQWEYDNYKKLPLIAKNILYFKSLNDAKTTQINTINNNIQNLKSQLTELQSILAYLKSS